MQKVYGISIIVSKNSGIESSVCTVEDHIEGCKFEKDEGRYQCATWEPLSAYHLKTIE